jgi:hypothetical protein
MRLSPWRPAQSQSRPARGFQTWVIAVLILLVSVAVGCSGASRVSDTNSAAGPSPGQESNANAGAHTATGKPDSIDIREPERFSATMTLSAQETASEAPAPMLTQQLGLAKIGSDSRLAFTNPAPTGQIVYLEKSGLKYLIFYERKQYAEVTPEALGFDLGDVFTPRAIIDRLNPRQYEKLGLEPVNGRTAIKYRSNETTDNSSHIDGVIFVDQETGLPLRSEMNTATPAGIRSRIIIEIRDLQLNPDTEQFDVPAGMKKIGLQDAKQQLGGFATALRPLAEIVSGKHLTPAFAGEPAPPFGKNPAPPFGKNPRGRAR